MSIPLPPPVSSPAWPSSHQPPIAVPIVPGRPEGVTGSETTPAETPPIRVLHLVNGEHFAGAERVQSHLGRCLPALGVDADFLSLKPGRFTDRLESHPDWGRSHRAAMRNRFDIGVIRRTTDLIANHQYDLLHAHTPRSAMIASIASAWTAVPWVYHVHSPAARDSSRRILNWINAQIESRAMKGCHGILTVSESLRADCIAAGYDGDRIAVVHNGVPAICPPRPPAPTPGGRWTLGMVALMRPRKGLEVALSAIARLASRGHDVRLRCIGPFETEAYADSIEQQIDRLDIGDRVERCGFVDDVPSALAGVDALLLPSLYGEGLPMVVLEAMAAATPVIATRVEGTPEAITHGVEGLLAKPGDVDSLAEQIAALVIGTHDWTAMSQAAKRRHDQAFSDQAMAAATARVYRTTLQRVGV